MWGTLRSPPRRGLLDPPSCVPCRHFAAPLTGARRVLKARRIAAAHTAAGSDAPLLGATRAPRAALRFARDTAAASDARTRTAPKVPPAKHPSASPMGVASGTTSLHAHSYARAERLIRYPGVVLLCMCPGAPSRVAPRALKAGPSSVSATAAANGPLAPALLASTRDPPHPARLGLPSDPRISCWCLCVHAHSCRCIVLGCTRGARSRSKFCKRHGGGRPCSTKDCARTANDHTAYCDEHMQAQRSAPLPVSVSHAPPMALATPHTQGAR